MNGNGHYFIECWDGVWPCIEIIEANMFLDRQESVYQPYCISR